MQNSKIEWTDHTFNPWIGCTKVSPGCANCYAETLMDTRYRRVKWGKGNPRSRTSESYWKLPLKWNKEAEEKIEDALHDFAEDGYVASARPRVFCASLADWLDDEVPVEWLADLLDIIRCTPNLDWLLLTKRPKNWRSRLMAVCDQFLGKTVTNDQWELMKFVADWVNGAAPHNVWLGTSVEDQERADERIPHLLGIPAKVRFLSCEPLLGPVDIQSMSFCANCFGDAETQHLDDGTPWCAECDSEMPGYILDPITDNGPGIHWVIAGGESGPGARPMHPDWVRSLRDQCAEAQVAFFFKQWGEWVTAGHHGFGALPERDLCWIREDGSMWETLPQNENDDAITCKKVGKHAAGRILDGIEHNEFPTQHLSIS